MSKLVKTKCLICTLLLILTAGFCIPLSVLAADEVYRMMHGEQDALVVGIIEQVTEKGYLTKVTHVISCKSDTTLNRQFTTEQIPERLLIEDIRYRYSYHGKQKPEAGDAIVISLDHMEEDVWQQVWLALEVSSTNLNGLQIVPEEKLTTDTYAWQLFMDSDGEISEFAYDSTSLYVDGELVFDEIDHLIEMHNREKVKQLTDLLVLILRERHSYHL